jgi:propanediol dehydratase small subunit
LLAAGIFLTGELVAFWYFNLSETWIPITLLLFVALGGGLIVEFHRQKRLSQYWRRACTGFRWRRQFPDAPKCEIREFLDLFVDAFGFKPKRRCCFAPDDRVMEIYRTVYPPGDDVDNMELEFLYKKVKKRYGIDLAALWREDVTLGEIYKQTHRTA